MERLEQVPPCRIIKRPPRYEYYEHPMMIGGMPVVAVCRRKAKRDRDGTSPEILSAGVCDA